MMKFLLPLFLFSILVLSGCASDKNIILVDSNVSSDVNVTGNFVSSSVFNDSFPVPFDTNVSHKPSIVNAVLAGTNITVSCTGSFNDGNCTINSTASSGGGVTRITPGFGIDVNSNTGDVNISIDRADLNSFLVSKLDGNGLYVKLHPLADQNITAFDFQVGGGDIIVPQSTATQGVIRSTTGESLLSWCGEENLFIGTPVDSSGNCTLTGSGNQGYGAKTLQGLTTGSSNVANGFRAMRFLTTGSLNLGYGDQVLLDLNNGSSNSAAGAGACNNLTSGSRNVCLGSGSLAAATTANDSTVLGNDAADVITNSRNTIVGAFAASSAETTANITESVCIGWNCDVTASNMFILGASNRINSTDSVQVAINQTQAEGQVDVNIASASRVGQFIRGAPSQTANLQNWVNSTGRVLSRIDFNGSALFNTTVDVNADGLNSNLRMFSHFDSTTHTFFSFFASRGTAGSPTSLLNGDQVHSARYRAHNGNVIGNTVAQFNVVVAGQPLTTLAPAGRFEFQTTSTAGSLATMMTIDSNAVISNIDTNVNAADLTVTNTDATIVHIRRNSTSSINAIQFSNLNGNLFAGANITADGNTAFAVANTINIDVAPVFSALANAGMVSINKINPTANLDVLGNSLTVPTFKISSSNGAEVFRVDTNRTIISKLLNCPMVQQTIISNAVYANSCAITLDAETLTLDSLDTVNGGVAGDILMLKAKAGDTITVTEINNIWLGAATRILSSENDSLMIYYNGVTWNEMAYVDNS